MHGQNSTSYLWPLKNGENSMKVKDAAFEILTAARTPLHAGEITERILESGLWECKGKTPAATVAARLYSDIKKHGDNSRFTKAGPCTFSLRENDQQKQLSTNTDTTCVNAAPTSQQDNAFSFTTCAHNILKKHGNKKPMHYKSITNMALEKGWLVTSGKTPEATMYAQIISEIKRQQKRGERPRFVQHGRGFVGLSQWMGNGLTFQIEQHNKQVRKALHKQLLAIDPSQFEELVAQLLAEMGFEMVEVTKLSGDGGIDVRGVLVIGDVIRIKMAVQVKRWKTKNNIQAPIVQQVRGSLGAHEQGLIITTSNFSTGAIKEAAQPDKTPIALMNGEQLVMLLMEHGIGVQRTTPDLFELDEANGSNAD